MPPRAPHPPSEGNLRFRYAIVGAGYTGLAAARRLAELVPDAPVAVIEGATVGEGASARNSGFVNPREPKIGLSNDQMARAEALNGFSTEGFDYLLAGVRAGAFACDLQRTGRITGAATELGARKIAGMVASASAHGFAHEELDAAGMSAVTGSDYYRCGIRTEEGYLLQPASLVRGLADTLPPTVQLFEQSPVLELDRGRTWTLVTPAARLTADVVILATNAGIKHFGHWRDGLVTIYTYAALTEIMSDADAARLGEPAWGLLPAHRLGTTMRRAGTGRLLVRSLYSYEKPVESSVARDALTACFHRRYPALRHVRLEHVWGGTTCLTMNGSPRWGRIDDNLYGSAGCNGSGVVKGTVLGKRLAEYVALGETQAELRAVYGQASRIAPEPFRTIGFHVISAIERRRAGLEM